MRKEELKNYSEEDQRLDTFYFSEQIGIQKYENLSFVLRLLLTVSHGQSDVERNFSLKYNLEQNNQSEETIVARRMIKDHLVSHNLKPFDVVIDQPLMLAVKNARMKYGKSLDEERAKESGAKKETEAMEEKEKKKEALQQVERDLAVFKAAIGTAEKSIAEGSSELGKLVTQKNMNRAKLVSNQTKIEMGVKRKAEMELEIELLVKKKKDLVDQIEEK